MSVSSVGHKSQQITRQSEVYLYSPDLTQWVTGDELMLGYPPNSNLKARMSHPHRSLHWMHFVVQDTGSHRSITTTRVEAKMPLIASETLEQQWLMLLTQMAKHSAWRSCLTQSRCHTLQGMNPGRKHHQTMAIAYRRLRGPNVWPQGCLPVWWSHFSSNKPP